MPFLEWIAPVSVVGGSVINLLLWADNWVHKRNTDATTIAAGLEVVKGEIKELKIDVEALQSELNRQRFGLESAENLRVERASRLDSDLRRLEATVDRNHVKSSARCEDSDRLLSAWTEHVHGIERRTVSIETWINRTLTSVRETPPDPIKGGHGD